jgi:hypothetical protein
MRVPTPKVATALARELVGFIWSALRPLHSTSSASPGQLHVDHDRPLVRVQSYVGGLIDDRLRSYAALALLSKLASTRDPTIASRSFQIVEYSWYLFVK